MGKSCCIHTGPKQSHSKPSSFRKKKKTHTPKTTHLTQRKQGVGHKPNAKWSHSFMYIESN